MRRPALRCSGKCPADRHVPNGDLQQCRNAGELRGCGFGRPPSSTAATDAGSRRAFTLSRQEVRPFYGGASRYRKAKIEESLGPIDAPPNHNK